MAEITVFVLCSLYIEHDEEVVIWNVQEEKEVFMSKENLNFDYLNYKIIQEKFI